MLNRVFIAVFAIFFTVVVNAQTHADATSQKWKGIDVLNEVIGNSEYDEMPAGDGYVEKGKPIILFNVGTGCFVIEGGSWGVEGRLFHPDFGRTMYLYSSGRINSGVTEADKANDKNSFGPNIPGVVANNQNWTQSKQYCFTTIMDCARKLSNVDRHYTFERVEDPSNTDTYTYYMYETLKNNVYFLGAAYGEFHNAADKGEGTLVFLDDDRVCWTTVDVRGVTDKYALENGDEVELQKLYQWRVISQEEFIEVLNSEEEGLNPSISSLIPDRDFTRNSDDFFGNWVTSPLGDYDYSADDKRYTYTFGNWKKGENQQKLSQRLIDEPWDSPVRLKVVFDQSGGNEDKAKNSKFGFLSFEGVGTAYAHFKVPKPGWYQLECSGFSQSANDNDAFMFARVIADADVSKQESEYAVPLTNGEHYSSVTLKKVPNKTYYKNTHGNYLMVGQELLYNVDQYRDKVAVCVTQEDIDNGISTIRVGLGKNVAFKSGKTGGGYYDTDLVCADDFRAVYMGFAPAFFYEDKENFDYLDADKESYRVSEFTAAIPGGRYSGATYLKRKFTTGQWNTFSFPVPLTGEQVRNAFGQDAKLLKLHSIGGLSNSENVIDFQSVNLLTIETVITPGTFYLLKPTQEPSPIEGPGGEKISCYSLGKLLFSTNAQDEGNPDYNHPVMKLGVANGSEEVSSLNGTNDGRAYVNYVQTPGFASFKVKGGIYKGGPAGEGSYATKGSYAMSGGKMYELSKDTPIKGFRGWLTLSHSIFDDSGDGTAAPAKVSVDGVTDLDGESLSGVVSAIEGVQTANRDVANGNVVYDLAGRRVGTVGMALPKGMYIVGGKKLLVK